jgi:hypothetical protein
LTLILSELVWRYYFDSTRAVAALITAFVLMVFLTEGSAMKDEQIGSRRPKVGA